MDAQKARAKQIRAMEQDRTRMYSYILSKLSKESLDEYKHHEDYELVSTNLSVKGLWIILGEIHALNTSSSNQVVLKKGSLCFSSAGLMASSLPALSAA